MVTRINSLDLPALLLELIESDRWCAPHAHRAFDQLFGEYSGVTFYSTAQMEKETSWWVSLAKEGSYLKGLADSTQPPGDIEPSQMVLIGDVGMGFDAPFALDYRTSAVDPRIIQYRWHEHNSHNRWLEIARNFSSFTSILNL